MKYKMKPVKRSDYQKYWLSYALYVLVFSLLVGFIILVVGG